MSRVPLSSASEQGSVRGFTLIELLVVISIIGLLSAVVLASLQTARLNARDAAIKQELLQLANLAEFEHNETKSYVGLNRNQWALTVACDSMSFTGNYASKAKEICKSIVAKTGRTGTQSAFYSGVQTGDYGGNPAAYAKHYSFMAYLPGASKTAGSDQWACVGSGGGRYIGPADPDGGGSQVNWDGAGCYSNP